MRKILVILACAMLMPIAVEASSKSTAGGIQRTKEFKVPGIAAWSAAKTNGFQFYPSGANGAKDGADTWGKSRYRAKRMVFVSNGAHTLGGVNMIVYNKVLGGVAPLTPTEISANFTLFGGKRLKPGWTIERIVLSGSYRWINSKKYQKGTNNIETKINIVKPKTKKTAQKAMLKEIVLKGPINGRWQDAFES